MHQMLVKNFCFALCSNTSLFLISYIDKNIFLSSVHKSQVIEFTSLKSIFGEYRSTVLNSPRVQQQQQQFEEPYYGGRT